MEQVRNVYDEHPNSQPLPSQEERDRLQYLANEERVVEERHGTDALAIS